jgi:curved DNA-binding protein CbpA
MTNAQVRKARKDELYHVLALDRDAPMSAVRAAYRRAAKKAHPDAGGSVETFAMVKLAADVLGDAERRKRYDETGEAEGSEPDNTEAQARSHALTAVRAVLAAIDKRNADYDEFDVLSEARRNLTDQRNTNAREIENVKKKIARLKKAAKKFTAKKGKVNLIGPMLENQAADLARDVATAERAVEIVNRSIEILNDHEFSFAAALRGASNNAGLAAMTGRSFA